MTEAIATVRITVLGEDTCPRNWWLCCPKPEPDPVPERPTDFVPLDQYDLEFTYPLKSSRKPSRNPLQDGCVNCGPVFATPAPPVPEPEPEPEPDPEPTHIALFHTYCDVGDGFFDLEWYSLDEESTSPPEWWDDSQAFTLTWGGWEGVYTDAGYYRQSDIANLRPECCSSLEPFGVLRQGNNVAFFNILWFCG